jgi:hypothetical protein
VKAFTIYDRETGRIRGHYYGSPKHLEKNTPEGCAAVPGRYDPSRQRIDPETREPVDDVQPEDARRRTRELKLRIDDLERRQARPLRELALDPGNATARARLEGLEAEIERLRRDLSNAGNQARSR